MSNTWTARKVYSRLKAIVRDYQKVQIGVDEEINKVQTDRRYTLQAKNEMVSELMQKGRNHRKAADLSIKQLRKDYAETMTDFSPVSVVDSGLSRKVILLNDAEIRVLQSLQYVPMEANDWKRLASAVDPQTNPAFALAIKRAAEQAGYNIRQWVTASAELQAEFDSMVQLANTVLDQTEQHSPDLAFSSGYFGEVIDGVIDSYDPTNKPEIEVSAIPTTPEESIAQDMQQSQNKTESDKAEELQFTEGLGGSEAVNNQVMSEAIAATSKAKFEHDYNSADDVTPADQTAAEQVEKVTLGGAVE